MAAKHLPSVALPSPQHTVNFIVVQVGYLEVSRLTGCLDFLKLCLSLKWQIRLFTHRSVNLDCTLKATHNAAISASLLPSPSV